MNETTELDLTEKPSWLNLPEEEKQKHTYWTCTGNNLPPKKKSLLERLFTKREKESRIPWCCIYHSKEEAEASASLPNEVWEWDRNSAKPITLKEAMRSARKEKNEGVAILGYLDGRWQTLQKYPVGVPLMSDD